MQEGFTESPPQFFVARILMIPFILWTVNAAVLNLIHFQVLLRSQHVAHIHRIVLAALLDCKHLGCTSGVSMSHIPYNIFD